MERRAFFIVALSARFAAAYRVIGEAATMTILDIEMEQEVDSIFRAKSHYVKPVAI